MRTDDPADPINALYGEHDKALGHLHTLGEASAALAAEGPTPATLDTFERAVRVLDTEIRAHNEWEEVFLFPRLELYMGPHGPSMVMRAEHRELWDLYEALGPLLASAREGRAKADDVAHLARVGNAIVELLTEHIHKENEILFPMARRFLSGADLAALRAARPPA